MSKTVEIIDEDKFVNDLVNFACAAHSIIDLDISADSAETGLIFLAAGVIKANVEEIVYEDATAESESAPVETNILGYTIKRSDYDNLPIATIYPSIEGAKGWIATSVSKEYQDLYDVVAIKSVTD